MVMISEQNDPDSLMLSPGYKVHRVVSQAVHASTSRKGLAARS